MATPPLDYGDTYIRTPRLLLRCWESNDAALLKAAIDSSLLHLQRWLDWAMLEPSPLPAVVERLQHFRADFHGGHEWVYAIFDHAETEVLGGTGLHARSGPGVLEIGYWLRADSIGRGYALETAEALTRFAFDRRDALQVEIRCDPNNTRSAAVPRKLGFAHVNTLLNSAVTPEGKPRDTMVWVLTKEDYGKRVQRL